MRKRLVSLVKGLVSIIIVSRNRREDLIECLHSIFRQDYEHFEVIVIDNASSDKTAEAVRDIFPKVLLIENKRNDGTCVTRNRGVEICRGEFVWFLDSDTEILSESFLSDVINVARKNPQLGAIGGEAVVDEEGRCIGVKRVNLLPNGFVRGEMIVECDYGDLIQTDVVVTANFFIKKEYLLSVGGFDPWCFFFGEDVDISYRLSAMGFRNVVFGKTHVFHKFSSKARKASIFSTISHFPSERNRLYLCLKHFPLRNISMLPIYDVLYLIDKRNVQRLVQYFKKLDHYGTQATVRAVTLNGGQKKLGIFTTLQRLIKVGLLLVLKISLGYVCILPWVPYVLFVRRHRQENYLNVVGN